MSTRGLAFLALHSMFWQATERWLSLTLAAALIPIVLEWLSKARSKPSLLCLKDFSRVPTMK